MDNGIFDDDSKQTESLKDNNSYNSSDNYEENESSQNSSNNKKNDLMRPKRGGVNNGKDKKSINQDQFSQSGKRVANIKSG